MYLGYRKSSTDCLKFLFNVTGLVSPLSPFVPFVVLHLACSEVHRYAKACDVRFFSSSSFAFIAMLRTFFTAECLRRLRLFEWRKPWILKERSTEAEVGTMERSRAATPNIADCRWNACHQRRVGNLLRWSRTVTMSSSSLPTPLHINECWKFSDFVLKAANCWTKSLLFSLPFSAAKDIKNSQACAVCSAFRMRPKKWGSIRFAAYNAAFASPKTNSFLFRNFAAVTSVAARERRGF